jgi:signal transduction histidine kinase
LARITAALSRKTGRSEETRAWAAGLLAPLGWFVSLATTGERPEGESAVPLARRVGRAWQLPEWLNEVLSHIPLPAGTLGGDGTLVALVRVALHLLRGQGIELHLISKHEPIDPDAALLGLNLDALNPEELLREEFSVPAYRSAYQEPLLREMLLLAAENLSLQGGRELVRLQSEVDRLQRALRDHIHGEADRLRHAKLAALGEFAAGAGHEINNPLAIISGQAQYVLSHAEDWLLSDEEGHTIKALQAIINQTKRVHMMLRELMQFARPAAARLTRFDLPTLVGEILASVRELAEARELRLDLVAPERLATWADPDQVRTALLCLVKNAVEAAPVAGWVRVQIQCDQAIEILVEDNGPGPSAEQRPHLFDPFYSGRNAGRGKGFGLPVAWRLARQQGGDVRLSPPRPGQPTRFILTLPSDDEPHRRAA